MVGGGEDRVVERPRGSGVGEVVVGEAADSLGPSAGGRAGPCSGVGGTLMLPDPASEAAVVD